MHGLNEIIRGRQPGGHSVWKSLGLQGGWRGSPKETSRKPKKGPSAQRNKELKKGERQLLDPRWEEVGEVGSPYLFSPKALNMPLKGTDHIFTWREKTECNIHAEYKQGERSAFISCFSAQLSLCCRMYIWGAYFGSVDSISGTRPKLLTCT